MIVGPAVMLDARMCARLADVLRRAEADARRQGQRLDPEVVQTIADVDRLARAYRQTAAASCANATPAIAPAPDGATVALTAAEVAEMIGTSASNVRARAERGSLPGTKRGGRWQFDPIDIADEIDNRTEDR